MSSNIGSLPLEKLRELFANGSAALTSKPKSPNGIRKSVERTNQCAQEILGVVEGLPPQDRKKWTDRATHLLEGAKKLTQQIPPPPTHRDLDVENSSLLPPGKPAR